ncbi:MAG: hypothetical protein MUF24_04000 [Chitinophagaceae bacterium]|jgi:hypothetical protein|nr:hypothetical protein [Chitinophagaceae bacterium]
MPEQQGYSQLLAVKKLVLDSLQPYAAKGNLSGGFSFNNDDDKSYFFTLDGSAIYTSSRHSYEAVASVFFQAFDKTSSSNRNHFLFRFNAFKYKPELVKVQRGNRQVPKPVLRQAAFNGEVFLFHQNDENRGIRLRHQVGINAVYNNNAKGWLRFNAGVGLLGEVEKWRLFENDFIDDFNALDPAVQQAVKDFFNLDSKFNVPRENIRGNIFINVFIQKAEAFSLNIYGALQPPFEPPFKKLPPVSIFPPANKKYPRYTLEAVAALKISKALSFNTRLYMQHDRGQIAPFAPEEVWNFTQGLSWKW